MTLYLLDANVVQEMRPGGNANVHAWLASVDDHRLRLSVVTFEESRKGLEREKLRRKGKDASDVLAKLADLEALAEAFEGRILDVDLKVANEWGRLLGVAGKNDRDTALAATARVHDLVLVTRNVKDVAGRDVLVLDPFVKKPQIKRV